jgi:hypothetical protein
MSTENNFRENGDGEVMPESVKGIIKEIDRMLNECSSSPKLSPLQRLELITAGGMLMARLRQVPPEIPKKAEMIDLFKDFPDVRKILEEQFDNLREASWDEADEDKTLESEPFKKLET